jgi:two-component system cell cycle sensor histidine kinase/response regulator CckA
MTDQAIAVLLIDDEPLVRAMAARMLRDLGYEVVQASGAGAALALSDEELADVGILMSDIVMPGIGGIQLAAMLEERRPGLPTLFMSGYVPTAGAEEAFHRAGTVFLTKPVTKAELAAALEALLGVRAAATPAAQ